MYQCFLFGYLWGHFFVGNELNKAINETKARWARKHLEAQQVEPKQIQGEMYQPRAIIGITFDTSLIIDSVLPNLPAEKVGLKKGDKIISIDNIKVLSQDWVFAVFAGKNPGDTVEMTVKRKGKKIQLFPALVKNPDYQK